MRDQVKWRKISRIIMSLVERLGVPAEKAMALYYNTNTCSRMGDERYGLHLTSDEYIPEDLINEIVAAH